MLYWKVEGGQIRQGVSIYHPRDKHSIGGCLRIGNRMWRARYSKFAKKWFIDYQKVDPNAMKKFEEFTNKV